MKKRSNARQKTANLIKNLSQQQWNSETHSMLLMWIDSITMLRTSIWIITCFVSGGVWAFSQHAFLATYACLNTCSYLFENSNVVLRSIAKTHAHVKQIEKKKIIFSLFHRGKQSNSPFSADMFHNLEEETHQKNSTTVICFIQSDTVLVLFLFGSYEQNICETWVFIAEWNCCFEKKKEKCNRI